MDDTHLRGAFGLTADKDTKATKRNTPKAGTAPRASRAGEPHVADALRNAYEQAVSEDVPQEFIDLLGKLA
jgi:hypothetical protein